MKKTFSKNWKSSKQPRKQRKYLANAPLHIKQKFMRSHLSKELRLKYKKRSLGVRKGDNIIIMRGQFKKKSGKVDRVDIRRRRVYIEGITTTKKDGSKRPYPVNPSNLLLVELNLGDKKRQKILERK
ncbi:50S ribosomal protein L24 [Candidatus Woesearchaeota archaeon]|nr:50S ribosomal protein L24 [Candidatus Woesearchaeota archaeon]